MLALSQASVTRIAAVTMFIMLKWLKFILHCCNYTIILYAKSNGRTKEPKKKSKNKVCVYVRL